MGKIVVGATMSLDGFIDDRYGNVQRLFTDADTLRTSEILLDAIQATGALIMGRNTYDAAKGDFTEFAFQMPVFVVTHHAPPPGQVALGQNDRLTFTFVTDGVASAVRQAQAAAADLNVLVMGSANVTQQLLRAGLVDELQISIMPVLFGDGLRLFEYLVDEKIDLEKVRVVETHQRTVLVFRVLSSAS